MQKILIASLILMASWSYAATNYILVININTQEVANFITFSEPPHANKDGNAAFMRVTRTQYTNDISLPLRDRLKNIPISTITNALYLAKQEIKSRHANYEAWDKPELVALVKVLLDEDNRWRKWLMDFQKASSNAVSLADFKTRVNNLDNLPQIDRDTMIDAIKNKLN